MGRAIDLDAKSSQFTGSTYSAAKLQLAMQILMITFGDGFVIFGT